MLEEQKETTTITYEREGSKLKEIRTPLEIVPEIKTYDIDEIKKEIKKIDGAIKKWEDKKEPLQEIVDRYENMK
jgi:phage terminase Nu1 subunit (DNA packaging protein)